jgi:peptide/nickel transport system substrate-binding protein
VDNYPTMVITAADLNNVPVRDQMALGGWTNPWIIPTPAIYNPECIYWGSPDQHKA